MSDFRSFRGNDRVKNTLKQMLSGGRLPHALILEGERGLGKSTLADIIAKALVCSAEDSPCGVCGNCHLAHIGAHPDIIYIEGEKQISVGRIRDMVQDAFIKPSQAKHKVYIIKKAETIIEAGQNAILKTLEEPPSGVHFILLSESKADLIETVVSRCTVLSLSPPSVAEGTEVLVGKGFGQSDAENALIATGGNIGRALERLSPQKEKVGYEELYATLEKGDAYGALLLFKKLEKDRHGTDIMLEKLQTAFLSARRSAALAGDTAGENWLRFITDILREARESCQKNGNLSLIFHNLCLKLGQ